MPRVYLSPTRDVLLPADYLAVKRMHDARLVKMTNLHEEEIQSEKQRKAETFPLINFVEFRPPLYITSGGNYKSGISDRHREAPWAQTKAMMDMDELQKKDVSLDVKVPENALDQTLQSKLKSRMGIPSPFMFGPDDEDIFTTKDAFGKEHGALRVSPAKVATLHQMQRFGRAPIREESQLPPSMVKPDESPHLTHRSGRTGVYSPRKGNELTSSFTGWPNEDTWGGMEAPRYPYQGAARHSPDFPPTPEKSARSETPDAAEEMSDPPHTRSETPIAPEHPPDTRSDTPIAPEHPPDTRSGTPDAPALRESDRAGEASAGWEVQKAGQETPLQAGADRSSFELTSTSQRAAGPPDPSAIKKKLDSSSSSTTVYYTSLHPRSPVVPLDQSLGSAYGVTEATPWKALPSAFASPVLRGSEAPSAIRTPESQSRSPEVMRSPEAMRSPEDARSPEAMHRNLAIVKGRLDQEERTRVPAAQLAQQVLPDTPPTVIPPPTTMDTPLASTLFGYVDGPQSLSSPSMYQRPGTGMAARTPNAAFSQHRSAEEQEIEDFFHALKLPPDLPTAPEVVPEQSQRAPPIRPETQQPRRSRDVFWQTYLV